MTSRATIDNLSGHVPEPIVQDQVIAYIEHLACSFLLRDIYRPLGLPRTHVNRVLGRLHDKGILDRWPIPVESHRFDRKSGVLQRSGATRTCFLYAFAEEVA